MEHRESLLFAPAGQVQGQFLQGGIMTHHQDVAGILRQGAQAPQHGPGAERVQAPHYLDAEIGGQARQDTAHRLHRPAPGGTQDLVGGASRGRQFLSHCGCVLPAPGSQ